VSFAAYLDERRRQIEAALASALPAPPRCPAVVSEAMRYSLMAGGKRLRPILALASAEAVAAATGGSDAAARDVAMPAACAIEMIHTYSLVHDDLPAMDDDSLRRGRPTLHVVHGEGQAILAGDALLTEAFGLLAREPQGWHPQLMTRKLRVLALVAEAAGAVGMVGGQANDLAAAAAEAAPLDAQELQAMHARKTGALIRASVASGAVMAGADDRMLAALDRYGTAIGLAFQIVDDILDVEGAADTLGKTAGKDAAAGKPTYPSLFGLERSRALAAEELTRARAALESVGLADSRLADIAAWIVERKS
jgi:geranylgeranyl diphosphate synthase type II